LRGFLNLGGHLPFSVFPLDYHLIEGYGNVNVQGRPELSPILQKYTYGGPGTLGPYWEEPGRSIVVSLYRAIVPPETLYQDVTRHFFPRTSESGEREKMVEISSKMTIGIMRPYARTWSSYHGWVNDFPDRKSRESGGEGDIIDEMFDALKEATGWDDDTEFDVEWTSSMLLARKKDT
jgi:trans-aconitate 3-methyltransferase